ncbi:hypothetical protein [uncultured Acetobacteroides sp.]|uniref:hypothetical protein n=1 Tax=uncultured Acetobacteroides sp. TaxID=1760811 RepID=UPI0029F58FD1|nr:hypothetical protein [uncultured Acetobacteroides sp.]
MKKIIITLAFSCLIGLTATFAQKVNSVAVKDFTAEYITIGEIPSFSSNVRIGVDFGQKIASSWKSKEIVLTDDEGKPMDFNTTVAALNFMYQNGYELVNTYTLKSGEELIPRFVLRKKKN